MPFGQVGVVEPLWCDLAKSSFHGQKTLLHCPLKSNKEIGTPLQVFGNVVTARQPFKFPIGLILGHFLATGDVVEPLWCDACRVVMPQTNHSLLSCITLWNHIKQYEHLFSWIAMWLLRDSHSSCPSVWFWLFGHRGVLWSHYGVMLVKKTYLTPPTQVHSPLKAYKAIGTPLQLYHHVVTAQQSFKLPIGLIFWLFGHRGCCGAIMVWCL